MHFYNLKQEKRNLILKTSAVFIAIILMLIIYHIASIKQKDDKIEMLKTKNEIETQKTLDLINQILKQKE